MNKVILMGRLTRVFPDVVSHRLVLSSKARMERLTDRQLAANILETTAVPRLKKGKA